MSPMLNLDSIFDRDLKSMKSTRRDIWLNWKQIQTLLFAFQFFFPCAYRNVMVERFKVCCFSKHVEWNRDSCERVKQFSKQKNDAKISLRISPAWGMTMITQKSKNFSQTVTVRWSYADCHHRQMIYISQTMKMSELSKSVWSFFAYEQFSLLIITRTQIYVDRVNQTHCENCLCDLNWLSNIEFIIVWLNKISDEWIMYICRSRREGWRTSFVRINLKTFDFPRTISFRND